MVGQRHVTGIWLLASLSAGIKNNTHTTVGVYLGLRLQFFAMTRFIAGIKNNTRATINCSAGINVKPDAISD